MPYVSTNIISNLFKAISVGELATVQAILRREGVLAADNRTVLNIHKADWMIGQKGYANALHVAAAKGQETVAMWLIDTFPSLRFWANRNKTGITPAFRAGSRGHLSLLKKILQEAGFLDAEFCLNPSNAAQLQAHLQYEDDGFSALSSAVELGCQETVLWLQSLQVFDFYSKSDVDFGQNTFQLAILYNQFPTFVAIAKAAGILDCFGIANPGSVRGQSVIPTNWLQAVQRAFSLIPSELVDSLVKAGFDIDEILSSLSGQTQTWRHKGRVVSETAAQTHIAKLASAFTQEDTDLLPLSVSMSGNSLLTQLIKSRAIDKINFRLAQGDALPLPPQMEAVTLPIEAKAVVEEKEMLLLNCHLIYHAQRILHTLKENPLNSAFLQKHLEPMTNLILQWPNLDGARCLPALKALILAIHEQIQSAQSEVLSDLMLQALLAWPRSQPASDRSPLTPVKPPQFTLSYHHYAPEEPLGAGAAAAGGAPGTKAKPRA